MVRIHLVVALFKHTDKTPRNFIVPFLRCVLVITVKKNFTVIASNAYPFLHFFFVENAPAFLILGRAHCCNARSELIAVIIECL